MLTNPIDEAIVKTIENSEIEIRTSLLEMSDLDLYNLGLYRQFVKETKITNVISIIYDRYKHLKTLERIIENKFQIEGEFLPKSHEVQTSIAIDATEKVFSMVKAMKIPSLSTIISLLPISEAIKGKENISIIEIIKLIDAELDKLKKSEGMVK